MDSILAGLQGVIVRQYRQLSDTIIREFQLIDTTQALIQGYNDVRNAPTAAHVEQYQKTHKQIETLFTQVSTVLMNDDSKNAFDGVKSTIQNVMAETDSGINTIQKGDIEGTSAHFAEANRKFNFVQENVATLIFKELEYSKLLQLQIQKTYTLILWSSVAIIVFTIALCIVFSSLLSKNLVLPLINLTGLAKVISSGNLDTNVDKKLLDSTDEIGSLSNSFQTMILNLRTNIGKLGESNQDLLKAKSQLEGTNGELERFNRLAVDRELKMIELKKRVAELEAIKISSSTQSIS